MQIGEPGRTVEQFFHDVAWAKIQSMSSTTIELISAYLSRSKESLDEIELSIRLNLAVATYGGYLRYVISQPERKEQKQAVNAFAKLMASQRQLCQQSREMDRTQISRCVLVLASKNFLFLCLLRIDFVFAFKCFVFAPEGVLVFVYTGNHLCFRC